MQIYQASVASPAAAAWLQRLLLPAAATARITAAPPVELRPTRHHGGWCPPRSRATDGRVVLSHHARLWTPGSIVALYLHEAAHRLLYDVRVSGYEHDGRHDAAFYCCNLVMLLRTDREGVTDHLATSMAAYDLQDRPTALLVGVDGGLGRCVTWAATLALELAESKLTAEAAAAEIATRYVSWRQMLEGEPERQARQRAVAAAEAQRQRALIARLRDRAFRLGALCAIQGAVILLAGWLVAFGRS